MSMENYQKIKELLLDDTKNLTSEQARSIIETLAFNPHFYDNLLSEEGAFMYLNKYMGVDDDEVHRFEKTNIKIFSEKIAIKFLKLQNDFVFSEFMELISFFTFFNIEDKPLFFSWPYMSLNATKLFTYGIVKEIIESGFFVFDFAEDEFGTQFGSLFDLVSSNETMGKLLAVSSLNITSFVSTGEFENRMNFIDAVELNYLAGHYFEESGDVYPLYRKMFIKYLLYVDRAKNVANSALSRFDPNRFGKQNFS